MGTLLVWYRRIMAAAAAVRHAFLVVSAIVARIGTIVFMPDRKSGSVSLPVLIAHVLASTALITFLVITNNIGLTLSVSVMLVVFYFCIVSAAFFALTEDKEIWDGLADPQHARFRRCGYAKSVSVVGLAVLIIVLWMALIGMSFDAWTGGALLASRPGFVCTTEICKYVEFLFIVANEIPGLDWLIGTSGLSKSIRFTPTMGFFYKTMIYLSCWWLAFKAYGAITTQRREVGALLAAFETQTSPEVVNYIIERIKFAPTYIRGRIISWSVRHRDHIVRSRCIEVAERAAIIDFPQTFVGYLHAESIEEIKRKGLQASIAIIKSTAIDRETIGLINRKALDQLETYRRSHSGAVLEQLKAIVDLTGSPPQDGSKSDP